MVEVSMNKGSHVNFLIDPCVCVNLTEVYPLVVQWIEGFTMGKTTLKTTASKVVKYE